MGKKIGLRKDDANANRFKNKNADEKENQMRIFVTINFRKKINLFMIIVVFKNIKNGIHQLWNIDHFFGV